MKGSFFMLRNNYFGETKTHYKLYKCGKNWAVMGISLFSLGLGMLVTGQPVSADVTATSTSSSAVRTDTTSASSSSAAKAETTSASSSSAAKAETTSASSSSATNVDSTNGSAANGSSATNVIKRTVNIAKLTRYFTQLKTNKASKTNTDNEALTKDTFLDYFSLNGSATYDKNSGIVTITPDEYNKIGNFSLKSKIEKTARFKVSRYT